MSNQQDNSQTDPQEFGETKKLKNILVGFFISFLSVVVLLGGLELVAYSWEKRTAAGPLGWTLVASRRIKLVKTGNEDSPYHIFVTDENYTWEGIEVDINSRGLRTDNFKVPKPTNTFRILNIGDSVAFGWEVDFEQTYGKQLEFMLNELGGGQEFEVINAAIPTWTTVDERNFLLDAGLSYDPDLVILDFTIVNDVYGKGIDQQAQNPFVQWLRDHTYGWSFLTTQMRFLLARRIGPEAIPVLNPPENAEAYFPVDENSATWDDVWEPISEIHQACQDYGLPLIVIAFPTAFQLNSASHPNVPQQVLYQRAMDAGIPYIDLLPTYRQICDDSEPDACEGYENILFADVWMHPNELGHRIAAEELALMLEEEVYLIDLK